MSSKCLLSVHSLVPDAAIPDHAAAARGPTVASAEFIAGLAARASNATSHCSLYDQLAGRQPCYTAAQLHTVSLNLPRNVAAGCRHAAAATAAPSNTAHPQLAKHLGHARHHGMPGSCNSSFHHLQHQHELRHAAQHRYAAGAPATAPIASTLGAAATAAAASRLQAELADSNEAGSVHLPQLGRHVQQLSGAARVAAPLAAARNQCADDSEECQYIAPSQMYPLQDSESSTSNTTGEQAAGTGQGACTLMDTYFDSVDKAGKLDTPREDAAVAVALGFAKAVAAGSSRATAECSISTASLTMQLAGQLGDAADNSSNSRKDAAAQADNPAGATVETCQHQEEHASGLSSTSTTAASSFDSRRAAVPKLRLQQQQADNQVFSSSSTSSPSSTAAAVQQSCSGRFNALPVLSSPSSGSLMDDVLLVSSPRSSRLAFPIHMQQPATAATAATYTGTQQSSSSGHRQGMAGAASIQSQPAYQAPQLFGALPALGSPKGTWAVGDSIGQSNSRSTAGSSRAAYLKLTARVLAQEPAEPGPGIILAP